jgi:hypothetical protein
MSLIPKGEKAKLITVVRDGETIKQITFLHQNIKITNSNLKKKSKLKLFFNWFCIMVISQKE